MCTISVMMCVCRVYNKCDDVCLQRMYNKSDDVCLPHMYNKCDDVVFAMCTIMSACHICRISVMMCVCSV